MANYEGSVALGNNSWAQAENTVSVGNEDLQRRITNVASGIDNSDVATIGQLNSAIAGLAGGGSQYLIVNSTGGGAAATGTDAIAIGSVAQSEAEGSIAVGRASAASSGDAIAIGSESVAQLSRAIAIGPKANATGLRAIAIGGDGSDDDDLGAMAEALEKALGQQQAATMWFMQNAMQNPNHLGAGAHHYMHIMGIVTLGWMWLRMAKVAQTALASDTDDKAFYEAKLATARYYMDRFLPDVGALRRKLEAGADSLMALDEAAFSTAA